MEEWEEPLHPGSLPHSPHGMAAKRSFDERGKLSDHLAERCIFAADSLDVTHRQVFKWQDVGVQSDSSKIALTRAT